MISATAIDICSRHSPKKTSVNIYAYFLTSDGTPSAKNIERSCKKLYSDHQKSKGRPCLQPRSVDRGVATQ